MNKNRTIRIESDGRLDYNPVFDMVKETTIQLRLSNDKKDKWLKEAKKLDKSMTRFVTDLVDDHIQKIDHFEKLEKSLIDKLDKLIDKKLSKKFN